MASYCSTLNEEAEKDIIPWLKFAEDLRRLKLDVEVFNGLFLHNNDVMCVVQPLAQYAANLRNGRSIFWQK
jgi:hypothetical protein